MTKGKVKFAELLAPFHYMCKAAFKHCHGFTNLSEDDNPMAPLHSLDPQLPQLILVVPYYFLSVFYALLGWGKWPCTSPPWTSLHWGYCILHPGSQVNPSGKFQYDSTHVRIEAQGWNKWRCGGGRFVEVNTIPKRIRTLTNRPH